MVAGDGQLLQTQPEIGVRDVFDQLLRIVLRFVHEQPVSGQSHETSLSPRKGPSMEGFSDEAASEPRTRPLLARRTTDLARLGSPPLPAIERSGTPPGCHREMSWRGSRAYRAHADWKSHPLETSTTPIIRRISRDGGSLPPRHLFTLATLGSESPRN